MGIPSGGSTVISLLLGEPTHPHTIRWSIEITLLTLNVGSAWSASVCGLRGLCLVSISVSAMWALPGQRQCVGYVGSAWSASVCGLPLQCTG